MAEVPPERLAAQHRGDEQALIDLQPAFSLWSSLLLGSDSSWRRHEAGNELRRGFDQFIDPQEAGALAGERVVDRADVLAEKAHARLSRLPPGSRAVAVTDPAAWPAAAESRAAATTWARSWKRRGVGENSPVLRQAAAQPAVARVRTETPTDSASKKGSRVISRAAPAIHAALATDTIAADLALRECDVGHEPPPRPPRCSTARPRPCRARTWRRATDPAQANPRPRLRQRSPRQSQIRCSQGQARRLQIARRHRPLSVLHQSGHARHLSVRPVRGAARTDQRGCTPPPAPPAKPPWSATPRATSISGPT